MLRVAENRGRPEVLKNRQDENHLDHNDYPECISEHESRMCESRKPRIPQKQGIDERKVKRNGCENTLPKPEFADVLNIVDVEDRPITQNGQTTSVQNPSLDSLP